MHPRAILLAMITMRKSINEVKLMETQLTKFAFQSIPFIFLYGYGAPLGDPLGSRALSDHLEIGSSECRDSHSQKPVKEAALLLIWHSCSVLWRKKL